MNSENEILKKEIGVRALTLAIVGIVIGSGIYVLPAIIADKLGATAILAYFACGFVFFLIALCFAELGSKTNVSGGMYHYIEEAFGPFAGFLANTIYWLGGAVLSDAAISNAMVSTLARFFPVLETPSIRILFIFLLFSGFAFLNVVSVKNSVRLVELASFTKLIPLILIIILSFQYVETKNLIWTIEPTFKNIGAASLLLFFAFLGFEVPLSNGAEIKNPQRTVPLGVFFALSIILVLYISIQFVLQGVLGDNLNAQNNSPLADLAGIIFGKTGIVIMIIATAISMFGALGGEILSMPRVLYAGAKKGLMPKPLSKVHPKFLTPYNAIFVYAGTGFLIAISNSFQQLAVISSASILILYFGITMATIKLRKKESLSSKKTFKAPGGIVIPIVAAVAILWLLSNLKHKEIVSFLVFIGVLSIIYFVIQKFKKK